MAEDLESLDNLHALCSLMQTICKCKIYFVGVINILTVMMNDHGIYEHILEDDIFFGVVGMLECTLCSLHTSVILTSVT